MSNRLIPVSVGGVMAIALFVLAIVNGIDIDRDGSIAIPGEKAIDLPAGEVTVWYREQIDLPDDRSLRVPAFEFRLRGLGGLADPPFEQGGGSAVGIGDSEAVKVGTVAVAEAGRYGVVTSTRLPGRVDPEITFGTGSGEAVVRGLRNAAISFGAGLLLTLLWPLGSRLLARGT